MSEQRARLNVEELGRRDLPSSTLLTVPWPVQPPMPVGPVVVAGHDSQQSTGEQATSPALSGGGSGSYDSSHPFLDDGVSFRLTGKANLAGLGKVTVAADLHSVGFTRQGQAGGTMTLTNGAGTVTVELHGPTQDAFSPLPRKFHYRVVTGTGAYGLLHGGGWLSIERQSAITGLSPLPMPERGKFQLEIHPT